MRVTLHVGTYARAGGLGLYRVDYDPALGFSQRTLPYAGAPNASFGVWSARHQLLYLVEEQAAGAVGTYRREGSHWHKVGEVRTGGREPCYVALDGAEQRLAVANYASGSIALFDLSPTGLPRAGGALWANQGSGPHPDRQDAPHFHCVRFSADGRHLHAVDLGTDAVLRFPLGASPVLEHADSVYHAPAGSGPRHVLLPSTQPIALLVSELASTLSLLRLSQDELAPHQSCSTLPAGFPGESLGGHLGCNAAGDRVYVSNRGHDSIAVFALDARAPRLALLQHVSSGGRSPRFFLLLEDIARLIVVHEQDGMVAAFEIATDGTLLPTGQQLTLPAPAFIWREPLPFA